MVPADGPHAEVGNRTFSKQAHDGRGESLSKHFTHRILEYTQSDFVTNSFSWQDHGYFCWNLKLSVEIFVAVNRNFHWGEFRFGFIDPTGWIPIIGGGIPELGLQVSPSKLHFQADVKRPRDLCFIGVPL